MLDLRQDAIEACKAFKRKIRIRNVISITASIGVCESLLALILSASGESAPLFACVISILLGAIGTVVGGLVIETIDTFSTSRKPPIGKPDKFHTLAFKKMTNAKWWRRLFQRYMSSASEHPIVKVWKQVAAMETPTGNSVDPTDLLALSSWIAPAWMDASIPERSSTDERYTRVSLADAGRLLDRLDFLSRLPVDKPSDEVVVKEVCRKAASMIDGVVKFEKIHKIDPATSEALDALESIGENNNTEDGSLLSEERLRLEATMAKLADQPATQAKGKTIGLGK